jgi:hypothetical protein
MGYFQRNQDVLDPLSSMKRADYGLPEDKFLFACFNQLYKMDADVFSAWLVFSGLIVIECCLFFFLYLSMNVALPYIYSLYMHMICLYVTVCQVLNMQNTSTYC